MDHLRTEAYSRDQSRSESVPNTGTLEDEPLLKILPETPSIPGTPDETDELPSDVLELPLVVRDAVTLTDDPTIPVVTFRFVLLTIVFVVPGAFLDTMNSYRTTSAAYSIFFVQIASHWAGKWLARTLPKRQVGFGSLRFDLNPGPWSIKETALVTIAAALGATGNLGTSGISLAELYYHEKVNPVIAILYMWAIVFTGYSYAAIARNFLLYDPKITWPQALMQTNLFNSQARSDRDSKLGSSQMRIFFLALVFMTCWQFLPELVFPFLSSLAVLCWIAPHNHVVNFLGSGMGGIGLLNLSLDWSNVTSKIMIYPYWVQVVQFTAFVFGAWILLPIAKWSSLVEYKFGLMSNGLFTTEGAPYPVAELITPELRFNETAYAHFGEIHMGAQKAWNTFFDYAAYVSGALWALIYARAQLMASVKRVWHGRHTENNVSASQEFTDRLNRLQGAYPDVPQSWYIFLFLGSFVTLTLIFASGGMFIPVWTYFVALVFGAVIVTPLAWLYAVSNFQLAIGTFNELLYGYMVQNLSHRHPAGASTYGAIAGDAWYRAQFMLQDQKIGHYMHLPPQAVFMSQIFGELIGVPVNYIALRWVLDTKREYLTGAKIDPLHQWTGQALTSSNTMAIQYVLLGPDRLFKHYPLLPYGFVLGAVAPMAIYYLHRKFPRARFDLYNSTVFFLTMSKFYGNLSTGYLSQFIGGTVTMFYAFRYKHSLWKKYNYILAAAFDTGFNLAVLLIFLLFSLYPVDMPHWWGNNAESVERCFAL
ncbi:hypothetical protein BABINDRAFT_159399 [Babjeviella inositovora NRRL Y-12698]|uniref:OPT superfamily oligopeptide transporter n=1 Tax=Babjeviella inositovora NRRL Y-12698 TaxID=984486 RepID=A0A1E3R0J2_9ASCO|nr:uncharacterized protein BABINDRAFT_159399 [Babjeviella inositovora NRRL Y-12698]ODQ82907.1 hypothetical protein BABINDRAFT_159399 [Babjeviella inositovora NRRL Y-12698]